MQCAGQPPLCSGGTACLGDRNAVGNNDKAGIGSQRTSLQGLLKRPAQLIIPTSEYVWGKFPQSSPVS